MTAKKKRTNPANKFIQKKRFLFESEAFRALTCMSRCLLDEFMFRYNGSNNGHIIMSVREAGGRLNCSKDTVTKSLRELEEKGFIRCRQKGAFTCKKRHASEWVVTEYELNGKPATKDYMHWQKPR